MEEHKTKQTPFPRSIRLPDGLEQKIALYLEANGMSFNLLARLAIERFISSPQALYLTPVDLGSMKINQRSVGHKRSKEETTDQEFEGPPPAI
jgi:hypothetical protein